MFQISFHAKGVRGMNNQSVEPLDMQMQLAREEMVSLIQSRGVLDERVLAAMLNVRREAFFPQHEIMPEIAYGDFPFPIGRGATISQPYIVAYMTARLELQPGARVLEIGTGSGYQAAVLAAMGLTVWSLEVLPELAEHARLVLAAEGFEGVQVKCATGVEGWKEAAPFDAILVTCAPAAVPSELVDQLAINGRMILPVGASMDAQRLLMVRRQETGITCEDDLPVRFVPLV
jgi:protein-L-isoaspartate(D-aspartate) O-methyltransferase